MKNADAIAMMDKIVNELLADGRADQAMKFREACMNLEEVTVQAVKCAALDVAQAMTKQASTWSNFDAIADADGVTMQGTMPERHPVDAEYHRPIIVMCREVVEGKRGYAGEVRGADATLWCMESMRTANGIREVWAVRCSFAGDVEPVTYWGSFGEVTEFLTGYMDTCDIDVEVQQ